MFKAGQQIVCVEQFDGFTNRGMKVNVPLPVRNQTYEFEGYHPESNKYLYLKGFNAIAHGVRASFQSTGFRALEDVLQEIDISELTETKININQ